MTGTKPGHWRDSPENGTPHDRDMDRDSGDSLPLGSPPCPVRSCPASGLVEMRLELRKRQGGWLNLKAALSAKTGLKKRSFWLSWSETEHRFANGHDHKIAIEHYPEVLDTVRRRIAMGDFDMVPGPC